MLNHSDRKVQNHHYKVLKMKKPAVYYIARGISNVFLPPVFLVTAAILLLLHCTTTFPSALPQLSVVFAFGFAFPVLFFLYLMKNNHVADQDALIKEQRKLPYFFGIGISVIGLLVLLQMHAEFSVLFLWSSYLLTLITITVVNLWWKISAHLMSVGVGSAALLVCGVISPVVFLVILLLVSWSRLYLKCHTIAQVSLGALVGAGIAVINAVILGIWAI